MTYFVGMEVWQVTRVCENVCLLGLITELISSERRYCLRRILCLRVWWVNGFYTLML